MYVCVCVCLSPVSSVSLFSLFILFFPFFCEVAQLVVLICFGSCFWFKKIHPRYKFASQLAG